MRLSEAHDNASVIKNHQEAHGLFRQQLQRLYRESSIDEREVSVYPEDRKAFLLKFIKEN